MSDNSSSQITVRQFMNGITINMDGRVMQMTEQEGRDLALALNTHFAKAARAYGYNVGN